MRRSTRGRQVSFDVVDGVLEQQVLFPDGHRYTHRCHRESFQAVAHVIEERASEGVTTEELADSENLPVTQVNVGLAFLKQHGCVEIRHRRCYPTSACLFEDAMIEYCYLEETPK